ncbi:MAG: Ig domain-containing protein [Bulleidia sp.]
MNVPIGSPYYDSVQAAVEWHVLEPSSGFDPAALLTREWAASTLINLSGRKMESDSNQKIRDRSASAFPKQIEAAVTTGFMNADEKNRFRPKEVMEKEEALHLLDQMVDYINNRTFQDSEEENSVTFNEAFEQVEAEPILFDEVNQTAVFPASSGMKENSIALWEDDTGEHHALTAESADVSEDGETIEVRGHETEFTELISDMNAHSSFEVDFTQAEIIDLIDGTVVQTAPPSVQMPAGGVREIHAPLLNIPHEFNGYKINFRTTRDSISCTVDKKTGDGLKIHGSAVLNSVKPSYDVDISKLKIRDAYFKVDFTTIEQLSVKREKSAAAEKKITDALPSNAFLSAVNSLYSKPEKEITVPIASIRIPIPGVPLTDIDIRLNVKIYASGKAEVAFTQNHAVGMEVRDGVMRVINDTGHSEKTLFEGNTGITADVGMGVGSGAVRVADIDVEGGAELKAGATIHLYDDHGGHLKVDGGELPYDLLDDVSAKFPDVLVCADLSAHPVLSMNLNTSKTLLGKMGFTKKTSLLKKGQGELIPNGYRHMENGQWVAECTRKNREAKKKINLVESDQIRIAKYSLIVSPGEMELIPLTAIPKGYSVSDLIFESENPEIAGVSAGKVSGNREGSTIIRIHTSDQAYSVSCNVMVRIPEASKS